MALLDAVVYPQPQGHFGYGHRDASYRLSWSSDATGFGEWDPFLLASLVQNAEELGEEVGAKKASLEQDAAPSTAEPPPPVTTTKRKRRRPKVVKNEEEIERQRMTHIAVERNRRRQMNEYLAVLRSLMPSSYAQRGDQASIVGGAINYVRELEQLLQSLEVQRSLKEHNPNLSNPFASFFRFPQYSATSASHCQGGADGLQQLGLTTLHLNVSTAGTTVMNSFSLKVEDECRLSSVEEIAAAVHEILGRVKDPITF
ncbi:transcription factor bHLH96-like [Panicum miliaceum]|uniref:Transcription factor bHLH96-like n=1 Tax=Panicum miliaceum TaxID=4540 RepID=A0A3L6TMG4_PANMI|nr:transcription factor bHLH96-like [Panicum miliaceum]